MEDNLGSGGEHALQRGKNQHNRVRITPGIPYPSAAETWGDASQLGFELGFEYLKTHPMRKEGPAL